MNLDKLKIYAPIVLRYAVCFVILWFGINQLINPNYFLGYVPSWVPLSANLLIMINGIFEVVFGGLLLMGLFTRFSALILSLHMLVIAIGLGYNDIAIRDVGLALAAFAVFLNGKDKWCFDSRRVKSG